ncbi:transcriptional regulator, GntR family [Acetobacteraceae bacterium AT-5844]|nr:transcriptional regulator, GntR family [Acetobacteraceae bacterium AT-5844]
MKQKIAPSSPLHLSKLVRDLLTPVLEWIRREELEPGARLTEQSMARALRVSRTPVRAVLEELERQGVAERRAAGGYVLRAVPSQNPDAPPALPLDEVEKLCLRIARDRVAGLLPNETSEADLMRRYGITRPLLLRVLGSLSEISMVHRKPGHGWVFSQTLNDPAARAESYRFRLILEPAGILTPGFSLPPGWLAEMRSRHEAFMAAPWTETSAIALFEMNAAFHDGLAAASGNRHLALAVQQQTRLRRFTNYDWSWGRAGVIASCTQHLEIMEQLERGELEVASLLMRRHLERTSQLPVTGPRPQD